MKNNNNNNNNKRAVDSRPRLTQTQNQTLATKPTISSLQHFQSWTGKRYHSVTCSMKSPKHRSHPSPHSLHIHAAMIPVLPWHFPHYQGRSSYERRSCCAQQTISFHTSLMSPTVAFEVSHLLSIAPRGRDCCGAAYALYWRRSWRFEVEKCTKQQAKKTRNDYYEFFDGCLISIRSSFCKWTVDCKCMYRRGS